MVKKLFVFLFLIFITGCGNTTKTLKCVSSKEVDDRKVNITLVGNWSNEELKSFKVETTYHFSNTLTEEQKKSFQLYIDSSMATWKDKKGVKYTSNMESNSFLMSLDIDASKGQETLEEFGITGKNKEYENLKELLENDKYICE